MIFVYTTSLTEMLHHCTPLSNVAPLAEIVSTGNLMQPWPI